MRTFSNTIQKKKKLKMDQVLKLRADTIKLLEENIGKTLSDTNHGNTFLSTPQSNENETKNKEMGPS